MIENRSAPPGPVVPSLAYADVAKAIDWLYAAFGFSERLRTPPEPDGTIHHAQLATGGGSVILTGQNPPRVNPVVMVRVPDVDAHFEHAKQFGAKIVNPPASHQFGERQYSAEDLAGNRWVFTQSVADVSPEEWGARVAHSEHRLERLARPRWCYIEIPAADVHQSAEFYGKVFGWNIRDLESQRPSFDDAPGNISGAWVTGRAAAREPGLLPYVWVDSIDAVLEKVAANGGEVVDPRHHNHPGSANWIATFRDPAGNLIGLYQEEP